MPAGPCSPGLLAGKGSPGSFQERPEEEPGTWRSQREGQEQQDCEDKPHAAPQVLLSNDGPREQQQSGSSGREA